MGFFSPLLKPDQQSVRTSGGSVAKFDFWGKIQKLGIRNSMTYRLSKSRKSNFATEPSFALRGVLSLDRLWQQPAQQPEARALLAPIDAWFTEGCNTAALQKAKALLETLAG